MGQKIDDEKLKKLIKEGLAINKIALRLGVRDNTVRCRAKELGLLTVTQQKKQDLTKEELEAAVAEGVTIQTLAYRCGRSYSWVAARAKREGVSFPKHQPVSMRFGRGLVRARDEGNIKEVE